MSDGDSSTFREPRLAINRVYTKKGDSGSTQLVGGQRVDKDDERIEAYGTVDELNAIVGAARESITEVVRPFDSPAIEPIDGFRVGDLRELAGWLLRVQHELFNLGSILATLPEDVGERQPRVTEREIEALERSMDRCQEDLEPLRSFVLPGGSRINTDLHLARTVCRRAERCCVRLGRSSQVDPAAVVYLNRLSDAFFVWSRWASRASVDPEVLWEPNRAASGEGT